MLLSITDLFKQSWQEYKKSFIDISLYVLIGSLIGVIIAIPAVSTLAVIIVSSFSRALTSGVESTSSASYSMTIIYAVFYLFSFLLILYRLAYEAGLSQKIDKSLSQEKATGFFNYLKSGTKVVPKLLVATILVSLAVGAGFILLVIPGIFLFIALLFVQYEIILKNKSIGESVSGSMQLVKGRWWAVFSRFSTFVIVFLFSYFIVSLVLDSTQGLRIFSGFILMIITEFFIFPFFRIYTILLYRNLHSLQAVPPDTATMVPPTTPSTMEHSS